MSLSDAEIERAEAMVGLLRAYGDVRNQPTETELWSGCKVAGQTIARLLSALAECRMDLAEARELIRETEDRIKSMPPTGTPVRLSS